MSIESVIPSSHVILCCPLLLLPSICHSLEIFFTVSATRDAQEYRSSLSLLQSVFLTQESKRCLLHCRQILYQLSYQGSLDNHCTILYLINKKCWLL